MIVPIIISNLHSPRNFMFAFLKRAINKLRRPAINQQLQAHLTNHEMSVISSNCNGALILHDLNQQFRSPFVNLYLEPSDFIRYLENMAHYNEQSLTFETSDKPYPVGKLDDIRLHFMHYHSEAEAKSKWEARLKRINLDNLFIMMTDRDGATYQDLVNFDRLPFKHKVVFTHKPYPKLASAVYIQGFEQDNQVGDLYAFSGWNGKKYYDQFDYVSWFNQAEKA